MGFIKEPKKALFYLLLFIALLWFGDWMGWDFVGGRFVMPSDQTVADAVITTIITGLLWRFYLRDNGMGGFFWIIGWWIAIFLMGHFELYQPIFSD